MTLFLLLICIILANVSSQLVKSPSRTRIGALKAEKASPTVSKVTASSSNNVGPVKSPKKQKSLKKSAKLLCKSTKNAIKSLKGSRNLHSKKSKTFSYINCTVDTKAPTVAPVSLEPTSHPSSVKTTFSPSLSPTYYNCTDPDTRERDIASVVTSIDDTIIPGSPEDLALSWLLNVDTATNACDGGDMIRQRYALAVFYYSTVGSQWTFNTFWLTPVDECAWYGVTCSGGMVTVLGMDENKLGGSLPKQIAALTSLAELRVYNNAIYGSIPTDVFSLSNLALIDLEKNGLQGQLFLPELLKTAETLTSLRGSFNQFTGSIPRWIGNMTKLKEFWAMDNDLTGGIPMEITFLTNLETLYLSNNRLNGTIPLNIGALSNMLELDLVRDNLQGSIPPSIQNMSNLRRLSLGANNLIGTIPSAIGSMVYLSKVDLSNNTLTGSIPAGFGNLEYLEYFILHNNHLIGSLPDFKSTSLYFIDVVDNELSGSLPSNLFLLKGLNYTFLSNNKFSGPIPSSFVTSNATLTKIWLDGNNFTGTIPALPSPSSWSFIEEILLQRNLLTGSMPSSICERRLTNPKFEVLQCDCDPGTQALGQAQVNCANGCCTACFIGPLL